MDVGIFDVRVKATDGTSESDWSEPKSVEIIYGPILEIRPLSNSLFRLEIPIKNSGGVDAMDVQWQIKLDGGAFIGSSHEGSGLLVRTGETVLIDSDLIFGLGPTTVVVTLEYGDGEVSTRSQNGFVVLFFIYIVPSGG
jgi:hypothetical protein